jgi:hypothetical protein
MNQSLGSLGGFFCTTKNLHFDILQTKFLELNQVSVHTDVSRDVHRHINTRGSGRNKYQQV